LVHICNTNNFECVIKVKKFNLEEQKYSLHIFLL
jgi:hypothetical protein